MDTIKKLFRISAVLSLLHVLAAAAGLGWLVQTGRLDAARARQVVDLVMHGAPEDEDAAHVDQTGTPDAEAVSTTVTDEQRITADEIRWRNTDRYRAQLEQRLRYINLVRVDLDRQREQLERDRKRFEAQKRQQNLLAQSAGHQKELQIVKALKPKVALRQIMSMTDADAARLLYELDNRKVKKIFESAQTPDEQNKMIVIRKLIRDVKSADQTEPQEQSS